MKISIECTTTEGPSSIVVETLEAMVDVMKQEVAEAIIRSCETRKLYLGSTFTVTIETD